MRYLILAIFVYLFYLLIKFLLKLYLSGTKNQTAGKKKNRSKIDLNKIEEADYEEVKTPKKEN